MTRTQRALGWIIAIAIGVMLALFAYQRVSDPVPRQQRLQEEAVVLQARQWLLELVPAPAELEIVDPLQKNRAAGKVYIYPQGSGWQVSGHYRRAGEGRWQPWLMTLAANGELITLSIQDEALQDLAARDQRVTYKAPQ